MLISRRTHSYSDSSHAILSLYMYLYGGTYPHTHTYIKLILVPISRKSYIAYIYTEALIHVLVLLSILYLLRSPVGVIGLILKLIAGLFLYRSSLGVTELILVQKYPLVLQNLYLYRGTRRYI